MAKANASKVAGGHARSRALTPEQRKAIAQKAAATRWAGKLPHATHEGVIKFADIEIECAVLDDNERIVSAQGLADVLKHAIGDFVGSAHADTVAAMLREAIEKDGNTQAAEDAPSPPPVDIGALIGDLLKGNPEGLFGKAQFFSEKSGHVEFGVPLEIFAEVTSSLAQTHIFVPFPDQGDAMSVQVTTPISTHSMVVILDAATGFRRDQAADAACHMLESHVPEAVKPWVRTFRIEFFEQLFRLHGLDLDRSEPPTDAAMAEFAELVFERHLDAGLVEALRGSEPKVPKAVQKTLTAHRLPPELGQLVLQEYVASVTTVMKLSDDRKQFEALLERAHPAVA
jgi:hypothetical protein